MAWYKGQIYESCKVGVFYKKDPVSGKTLATLNVPAAKVTYVQGVTYDAKRQCFWLASGGFGLFKIPLTGGNALSGPHKWSNSNLGVFYDQKLDRLWVTHNYKKNISLVNLDTMKVEKKFAMSFAPSGIARVGNYLWIGRSGDSQKKQAGLVYRHDLNGKYTNKYFELPKKGYYWDVGGITFDGQYLWVKGGRKSAIYKIDIGHKPKPEVCGNDVDDDLDGYTDEGCPYGYLALANCENGVKGWARDSHKADGSWIPQHSKATSSVLLVKFYNGKTLMGQVKANSTWDSTVGMHGFVFKPLIKGAVVGKTYTFTARAINTGKLSKGDVMLKNLKNKLTIHAENCDGMDNDCDGQIDEGGVCSRGQDMTVPRPPTTDMTRPPTTDMFQPPMADAGQWPDSSPAPPAGDAGSPGTGNGQGGDGVSSPTRSSRPLVGAGCDLGSAGPGGSAPWLAVLLFFVGLRSTAGRRRRRGR